MTKLQVQDAADMTWKTTNIEVTSIMFEDGIPRCAGCWTPMKGNPHKPCTATFACSIRALKLEWRKFWRELISYIRSR